MRHLPGIAIAVLVGVAAQLIFIPPTYAAPVLDEWRFPDERDVTGPWKDFREDGREFYTAAADFDGDGTQDEAWILIRKDDSAWGLFVFLDARGAREIIELGRMESNRAPPQSMGLGVVAPGFYESACARGYGSGCAPGERRSVELKNPAIDFFVFESATSFFFWDDASGGFERLPTSD